MLIPDDQIPIHLFDFSILSCFGQFADVIIFILEYLHPKLLVHTLLSCVVCNVAQMQHHPLLWAQLQTDLDRGTADSVAHLPYVCICVLN